MSARGAPFLYSRQEPTSSDDKCRLGILGITLGSIGGEGVALRERVARTSRPSALTAPVGRTLHHSTQRHCLNPTAGAAPFVHIHYCRQVHTECGSRERGGAALWRCVAGSA